jgi:hypothetical protein
MHITQMDHPFGQRNDLFLSQLHAIRPLFDFCTRYEIHNGKSDSFWYNPWCGVPLLQINQLHPRPTGQRISVQGASTRQQELLPFPRTQEQSHGAAVLSQMIFTDKGDVLVWKWTMSGYYCANPFIDVLQVQEEQKKSACTTLESTSTIHCQVFLLLTFT